MNYFLSLRFILTVIKIIFNLSLEFFLLGHRCKINSQEQFELIHYLSILLGFMLGNIKLLVFDHSDLQKEFLRVQPNIFDH